MSRRRLAVLALAGAAGLSLLLVCLPKRPAPPVNREKMERVKVGMSYDEVVATVGGPPGNYSSGEVVRLRHGWDTAEKWYADDGKLSVDFDEEGRAEHVRITDLPQYRRGLRNRIRAAIGF